MPIIKVMRNCKDDIVLSVCKTRRHTDMLDSVMDIFGEEPDVIFPRMGKVNDLNATISLVLNKFQEYYSSFKPVLVTRDTTEHPEGVEAGAIMLVGTSVDKLCKCACVLIYDNMAYTAMSGAYNPYGDGKAAERILDVILKTL